MHKERVAAIAARGEQIKANSVCRAIRSPLLPDKPVITDPAVNLGGRLHRCARASTRRHFPRSLGDVAAVISVACHRANAGGPVFDPIGPRQSGRASANSGFLNPLQLRRRSTLDALPTLPAARCKAVQRHRRLFLPCLPPQSNLREPKKKPQSPRLSASLQAAAEAWRFAPGSRPHTTPTIPDETTTIPKTGNQN
jgi:hypothetical protein